jgi:DNA invertase Pin-like site-specific DNA recombinase
MDEIAKMETITLKTRVKVALQNLKYKGVILGRPKNSGDSKEKTIKKYPEVIKYLEKYCPSLANINFCFCKTHCRLYN